MPRSLALQLALVLAAATVAAAAAPSARAEDEGSPQRRPWRSVLAELERARDDAAEQLARVHESLERAARLNAPELLERLSPEPARPKPRGWGVLPEILEDLSALDRVRPRQRRYELQDVAGRAARLSAAVDELVHDTPDEPAASLAGLVERHEQLADELTVLDEHLAYHEHWQAAVPEWPDWFARNARLAARARRLPARIEDAEGGPEADAQAAAEADALRRGLVEELAPFSPPQRLRLRRGADGWSVLRLPVLTDVDDEAFRRACEEALAEHVNASEAARRARLRLEISWREHEHDEAPLPGELVDVEAHRRRFPDGSLVLTSGAASTHAFTGRAVVLGPEPLRPRELAHELMHLVGFQDAYLRSHDGRSEDPFGVVLTEWQGLSDDLMGSPDRGRFSEAMASALLSLPAEGLGASPGGSPGPGRD